MTLKYNSGLVVLVPVALFLFVASVRNTINENIGETIGKVAGIRSLDMLQIPSNCTGCQACTNICPKNCISMVATSEGFLIPIIDMENCIQCNQCEKVCPVLHEQSISINTQAFAIKNVNEKVRKNSASGGVFPLLAEFVLNRNGMVFGAMYDENFEVRHVAITDYNQIYLLQGAKYTQSIVGETFGMVKKELESGRHVLFSGTPCQCAGLKSYLGKEYENLLLVDLICHGVPSPKVWQAYIGYRSLIENNGFRPININMRSKTSGWSRYGYSTEFDYGNGYITRIHNYHDLFMKAFIGNICLRFSCGKCMAKGVERCSDITLGDYWGVWNQHPEIDDDKGVSIVFVHSFKGQNVLRLLREKIDCLQVDIEDAYMENFSLVNSSKPHEKRKEFLEQVTEKNFEALINKYFPSQEISKAGISQRVKKILKSVFLK